MSGLSWFPYEVGFQASRKARLSWPARGIDDALVCEAFHEPDGSCSVPVSRIRELCEDTAFDPLAIGRELVRSRLWEPSEDRTRLVASWLLVKREAGLAKVAQAVEAGRASGAKRRAEAEAKQARNLARREARERAMNGRSAPKKGAAPRRDRGLSSTEAKSLSGGDMHDRSTAVQQRDVFSGCSFPSGTNEQPPSQVTSDDVRPTAPAACRAEGASGAVVLEASAPSRVQPGHLARVRAAVVLEELAVPAGWGAGEPLERLVPVLSAAAPEVDVERALYRACAAWQKREADGHVRLLEEIAALLEGSGGRAGLVSPDAAPRAIALALHGALIMPARLEPVVLRAMAWDCASGIAADETDPVRVACWIAAEYEAGRRRASQALLGHEPVPERRLPLAGVR